MESLVTKNGHDSRDYLALDPCLSAVFDPLVENVVVVEELSYYEVSSSIYLFLEIADVICTTCSIEMDFRIASHSNAEEVSVLLSNELH